jgi:asparagine synthase (glutamine-hydrolysing)
MCGITGIWTPEIDRHRLRSEVSKAVVSLRHRGPDDEGVWSNDTGVALGHTRLSILDLSALGHQPMSSADGRFTIVFNGEIYNFADIRSELTKTGHSFAGTGDTEVILHAFSEWGSDAVQRFVGMFAIALWDEKEKTIQLVRDRLGVKPLHYGWDGRTLCFGSELKALRSYGHWQPVIDLEALGEFFQYGYIAGQRTIYKGIHKLKPGHRLLLRQGQQPVVEPYWSAAEAMDYPLSGSDSELEAELESLLIDSFRHRMVSDVPVGVYLSGGVDSSLVTAILAKHHEHDIRTFTIGFSESRHDEAPWAKQVAKHCGALHTEYILGVNEALKIAKDWGRLFDEPFGDSSGIPTLLVSRLASSEVKVVLSADGGDELFSGYNVYSLVLNRLKQLDRSPRWMARSFTALSSLLPAAGENSWIPGEGHRALLPRIHRLHSMLLDPTAGNLMDQYLSHWQPEMVNRLIGRYVCPRPSASRYPGAAVTKISLWDIEHYLPEDILTKVDRTTMAVSIEGREPLLDHRLVRFALALPPHLRRGSLGPKHLLKSILYRYVPRELVDRPKQGFAIPLDHWLKTDLKELVHTYLGSERINAAGIMDPALVQAAVTGFYRGDTLLSRPLWLLLAFEMWRENWG